MPHPGNDLSWPWELGKIHLAECEARSEVGLRKTMRRQTRLGKGGVLPCKAMDE